MKIANTLNVPQQTISDWLKHRLNTSDNITEYSNIGKDSTYNLPTSITLYPCRYEEVGYKQQQIADTLKVPRQTISRWLKNGQCRSGFIVQTIPMGNNATSSLPTFITLFPCRYEEVGYKQQQIADDLKVPRRTIAFWLNSCQATPDNFGNNPTIAKNFKTTLASTITLYQAKFEVKQ